MPTAEGRRPVTTRPASPLRRLRREESGATAVEFGILAVPFLFLLVAIAEIAMTFWSTQVLETAVANASREVYTGTFQTSAANAGKTPAQMREQMKTNICKHVTALFNCTAMVDVDVKTFSKNSDAGALSSPVNKTTKQYDTSSYGYSDPKQSTITVVRASMEYPALVSWLSRTATLANGKRLIVASTTFKTEPYSN